MTSETSDQYANTSSAHTKPLETDVDDEDLDLIGPEATRPGMTRFRIALATGIVAALAFTGSVLVQKTYGGRLHGWA